MNLKISVLIPTYNREKRLKKSLPSYLSSSRKDIEFIICDNASSDNTEAYIKSIIQKDNRVRYFRHRQNIGFSRNLFFCFSMSKAEYGLVLPDDDYMEGDYYQELINLIEKKPDLAVIHCLLHKEERELYREKYKSNFVILEKGESSISELYMRSGAIMGLAFKINTIDFNNYLLDNKIYPQVRIATKLAVNYPCALTFSKENYIYSLDYGDQAISSITGAMNRPNDFGLNERLNDLYALETDINHSIILKQKKGILTWGWGIIKRLKEEDSSKVYSKKMYNSISKNILLKNSPIFINSLIQNGYYLRGLIQLIKSFFSISFYRELFIILKILLEKKRQTQTA